MYYVYLHQFLTYSHNVLRVALGVPTGNVQTVSSPILLCIYSYIYISLFRTRGTQIIFS